MSTTLSRRRFLAGLAAARSVGAVARAASRRAAPAPLVDDHGFTKVRLGIAGAVPGLRYRLGQLEISSQ